MKVEIKKNAFEAHAKRGLERAKRLDRGEKVVASKRITFESPLDMLSLLTAERVRLIEMSRTSSLSVSALAAALKRDPKSVRRDVAKLEELGVLRTQEQVNPGHGRKKVVQAVAGKLELRASF